MAESLIGRESPRQDTITIQELVHALQRMKPECEVSCSLTIGSLVKLRGSSPAQSPTPSLQSEKLSESTCEPAGSLSPLAELEQPSSGETSARSRTPFLEPEKLDGGTVRFAFDSAVPSGG